MFDRLRALRRAGHDVGADDAQGPRREALRLIDEGNAIEDAGRLTEARQRYDAAIRLAPDLARGYLNRGNVLLALDDLDGALAAYATALEKDPRHAAAHFNMGNALAQIGRHEAALAAYGEAMALNPDFFEAATAVGNVLEGLGRLGEAETSYRRAAQIAPNVAEAHYNLSIPLRRMGRHEEAAASLRRALEIRPDYVEALIGLGNCLAARGLLEEAVASYRRATEVEPQSADAHFHLGFSLQTLGRFDDVEASFRRALQIRPDYVEAHYNLSITLRMQGRLDEAEASLRRVLQSRPDHVEALTGLGMVLEELMRLAEAEASYRRALEIDPEFALAYDGLLFCLSHDETVDPSTLVAEHRKFGERLESPHLHHWPRHGNDRDAARRLRVGFVSGDLRAHAVASFLEPLLSPLAAHAGLSLHAYSNRSVEDEVTARLRRHMEHWHTIAGLSDDALAARIEADGIDILVDLSGHTAANRLRTFARKPAPVQVSWMGYPGTTGLTAMDYYIADRHFLPRGEFDAQFVERLVYLPASAPFLPDANAPPVNILPALARGVVTFGSFSRPNKLSRPVVALWARLLRELPGSRMVFGGMPQQGAPAALAQWFAEERVAPERLEFHRRSDIATYLGLHHRVDLCLDAFPYSGGTTIAHALWMGVPTLTLAGRSAAGRQGASVMSHLRLDDFVVGDADAFVAAGKRWAHDPAALGAVRAGLRERFARSPLVRPDLIAAGLQRAFRIMWQRWCAGLPVEAIDVSADTFDDV